MYTKFKMLIIYVPSRSVQLQHLPSLNAITNRMVYGYNVTELEQRTS